VGSEGLRDILCGPKNLTAAAFASVVDFENEMPYGQ